MPHSTARQRLPLVLLCLLLPLVTALFMHWNMQTPKLVARQGEIVMSAPLSQERLTLLGGELERWDGRLRPADLPAAAPAYSRDILYTMQMEGHTYRFTLDPGAQEAPWFFLPRPHQSKLWVNDIEVLPREETRITSADSFYLPDYGSAPYTVVLQVTGASVYFGYQGLAFGGKEQIAGLQTLWLGLDSFGLGLTGMLVVFCLALFLNKRSETYLVLLAVCALVNSAHFLIIPRHPAMSFFHLGSLTFYRMLLCLYYFIAKQFLPGVIPKRADVAMFFCIVITSVLILVLPQAYQVLSLVSLLFFSVPFFFTVKGMLLGIREAPILLVGNAIALGNELFYSLVEYGVSPHGAIDVLLMPAQYTIILYILAFAIATCMKFGRKFQEADVLNEELEQRVQTQTRKLRDANESILDLHRQRQRFTAGVIHNLRNPLFALGGYMDLLRDELPAASDEQRRYLDLMDDKLNYMGQMSRNLLLSSRLEEGSMRFHYVEFPLLPLLESAAADAIAKSASKHVHIHVECPDFCMVADQFALRQALDNLLDNAVRHSPAGGDIHLCAALCAQTQTVRICLRDSGPGIDPALLPTLFDHYRMHEMGGTTGLGLSIAQALLQAHGGHIEAKNPPQGGAEFLLVLPVSADNR